MFNTQRQNIEPAIDRFRAYEKIETNVNPVYVTYTSGSYNNFFATEQEAIDHCANPDNGAEFDGQWIQDSYSTYEPGELFTVVGNEPVYASGDRSRFIEGIAGRWQMPFVKWKPEE